MLPTFVWMLGLTLLFTQALGNDIISYSMPQGDRSRNKKFCYIDTNYTGTQKNELLSGGTGLLTDGVIGPADSKKNKGEGWVGWYNTTIPHGINITFEFDTPREFQNVTVTVNVNTSFRYNMLFSKTRISFAVSKEDLSKSFALQYCPKFVVQRTGNINITLPLCGNIGKFVRMKLYPGGKWLLISEIKFASVSKSSGHSSNKSSLKTCSGDVPGCYGNVTIRPQTSLTPTLFTEGPTSDKVGQRNAGTEWHVIVVTLICGTIFGVIITHLVMFCLRRRRKARHQPRSSNPRNVSETMNDQAENVSTYQELQLRNMNEGDNYQSLTDYAGTDPDESTNYENERAPYQELNKVRFNVDDNYQSLLKR